MRKLGIVLLVALNLALMSVQFSSIWKNFNFQPGVCADHTFDYYIIPVPGRMDNMSWVALAAWLLIGLFFATKMPGKSKKPFIFLSIILGLGFFVFTVISDTKCQDYNNCGPQLAEVSERTYSRALYNLDPTVCKQLQDMSKKCDGQNTYKSQMECEKTITDLIAYKGLGIDVTPCIKTKSDCRDEYLNFFYDSLSNNLESAKNQCSETYGSYNTSSTYCENYISEWQQTGEKPQGNRK